MTDKTDFTIKTTAPAALDDDEIIDLTEKIRDVSRSDTAGNQPADDKNEDIVELSQEIEISRNDQDIIDLTQEVSPPPKSENDTSVISKEIDGKNGPPVSQQVIESIIERAVRKVLAEKLESILTEAVDRVIKKDLERIRKDLMQKHCRKT